MELSKNIQFVGLLVLSLLSTSVIGQSFQSFILWPQVTFYTPVASFDNLLLTNSASKLKFYSISNNSNSLRNNTSGSIEYTDFANCNYFVNKFLFRSSDSFLKLRSFAQISYLQF